MSQLNFIDKLIAVLILCIQNIEFNCGEVKYEIIKEIIKRETHENYEFSVR